jgi:hypothetical protein
MPPKQAKRSRSVADVEPAPAIDALDAAAPTAAAARVAAAQRFRKADAVAFAPWRGRYRKFRFVGEGCSAALCRTVVNDRQWRVDCCHVRLECAYQPRPALAVLLPASAAPLHTPRGGGDVSLASAERRDAGPAVAYDCATVGMYRVRLAGAATARVARPAGDVLGLQLVDFECAAADCAVEFRAPQGAWGAVAAGDDVGRQLVAAVAAATDVVRVTCVSADGCFIEMVRDFHDFCDHVVARKGDV